MFMIRTILFFLVACATFSVISLHLNAQQIQFSPVSSAVSGEETSLSTRERQRIERFLSHVFPVRPMRRLEGTSERPLARRATYSVISQEGMKFILVGYSARWENLVDVLAIYRMEEGGPNQVWRS